MIQLVDMLADPIIALWATFSFPFAARFFVAWTVWLRIRGIPPATANLTSRRPPDYRRPNNPVFEAVLLVVSVIVAWAAAAVLAFVLRAVGLLPVLVPVAFLASLTISIAFVFLRVREDDSHDRAM